MKPKTIDVYFSPRMTKNKLLLSKSLIRELTEIKKETMKMQSEIFGFDLSFSYKLTVSGLIYFTDEIGFKALTDFKALMNLSDLGD